MLQRESSEQRRRTWMKALAAWAVLGYRTIAVDAGWTDWVSLKYKGINAVTFATTDMAGSYTFYQKLGFNSTYGGPSAEFTTFGSSGGPQGGDNSLHINLFLSSTYKKPDDRKWKGWGRAIIYVNDVDAVYDSAVRHGLQPEAPPANADWGERYFQILDPMGHELALSKPLGQVDSSLAPQFQSINAVTFATNNMSASFSFYKRLALNCTFGGQSAYFTTFGSAGGPGGGDNTFHINIFVSETYKRPSGGGWNQWGRAILYVDDVDGIYQHALEQGLQPEAAPADAGWGERYFQILDPMGHELTIAKPISKASAAVAQSANYALV